MSDFRIEKDSMGELEVPKTALYGAQTQRAVNNFPISELKAPRGLIEALGLVKHSAAIANQNLGLLDSEKANAIQSAADKVISGEVDTHFPVDIFQTGSGTSSNMNTNEVISHLAKAEGIEVHPNDHVNCGQSSNDVFPTAIHVSAALAVNRQLLPAIDHFLSVLSDKSDDVGHIVKTGRTHLMDAMPVTFAQEMGGWASQVKTARSNINAALSGVYSIAQGGTAVGTGINAHPDFSKQFCKALSTRTKLPFEGADDLFEKISTQDSIVNLSGTLRGLSVAVMKIANDLRWMNSGPLAGLGEIALPSLQPGSSIMPGKVNPVICESAMMVCAQVMGNDTTVMVSGQHGNFQLNVMLPVIIYNVLQSIHLLSTTMISLADNAIKGFVVNEAHIQSQLDKNPILITALNAVIGYEKGAAIAKAAYAQKRPVLEVAKEMTDLSEADLKKLLAPALLTKGGIVG